MFSSPLSPRMIVWFSACAEASDEPVVEEELKRFRVVG